MKAKARVPDPRGEQPERLAANEAGCGRISLRAPRRDGRSCSTAPESGECRFNLCSAKMDADAATAAISSAPLLGQARGRLRIVKFDPLQPASVITAENRSAGV
jgi:hypothetical protein